MEELNVMVDRLKVSGRCGITVELRNRQPSFPHYQGFIQDKIFASPKCFENVTKCMCTLDCALGRAIKNVSIIYIIKL